MSTRAENLISKLNEQGSDYAYFSENILRVRKDLKELEYDITSIPDWDNRKEGRDLLKVIEAALEKLENLGKRQWG